MRIETPRLVLRPFEDKDTLPFVAYRSDLEVAKLSQLECALS